MSAVAVCEQDLGWDRLPTALEVAHYNSLLKRTAAEASSVARQIFGDCLHKLIKLGMREKQARTMLGKWRAAAKDDALLIRAIEKAYEIQSPEPVSYVTQAIKGAQTRTSKTTSLQKSTWTRLGWEAPTITAGGPKYKDKDRGEVWRDPFGKEVVLPASAGTALPSHEEEPGYTINKKKAA